MDLAFVVLNALVKDLTFDGLTGLLVKLFLPTFEVFSFNFFTGK